MSVKYYSACVVVFLLNFLSGCTTTSIVEWGGDGGIHPSNREVLEALTSNKIIQVQRHDGATIVFDGRGGKYLDSYQGQISVIVGLTVDGELSVTRVMEVRTVRVEKVESDGWKTVEFSMITVGVGLLVLLIWFMVELGDTLDSD